MPQHTIISAILKAKDHVICDIDSIDLWIKLDLQIESPYHNLHAELQLKVDKTMNGADFSKIVQKVCLRIWNQFCQDSQAAKDYLYIMTKLKIQKIDKIIVSHSIEDTSYMHHHSVSQIEPMSPQIRKATLIPNNSKIGEMFTYTNNQVNVQTFFETVEHIYMSQNPQLMKSMTVHAQGDITGTSIGSFN